MMQRAFLHCGNELNGLGPSWMVLTHGNVIFDILEPSAFQKYSIGWVFQAFFLFNFKNVFCNLTKTSANSSAPSVKGKAFWEISQKISQKKTFFFTPSLRLHIECKKCTKGSRQEKNGIFTVRRKGWPPLLTVRVLWFFQNKLTYFDLFYHL